MKHLKIAAVPLLVLFFLPRQVQAADAPKKGEFYTGPVIIGTETWPGCFPLYVAEEKGYFKKAGLNVQVKLYVALGDVSKDYVAGKIQARSNLTFDAVKESLEGLDHKTVLAIDYSSGADAIVARNDIRSVQDFKGKRVGYEADTIEEFFLTWILAENGIQLSEIVPVFANSEETAKMLQEGQLDIVVAHEPFMSKLIATGRFHVVFSSADVPGLITDILTFSSDFIETHPETVQAIVGAYFKALAFWKAHPAEANAIMAKKLNDTPEGISKQLEGVTMLDEAGNTTAFTFGPELLSLYGNMRQVGKSVLRHQKEDSGKLDTDKLVERKFIKKVAQEKSL